MPNIVPDGEFIGRGPQGMRVTTFYRAANLPRIHVNLAGIGTVSPARYLGDVSIIPPPPGDRRLWRRGLAIVDMAAARPFMSLSFAKTLGYDVESLDTRHAGKITELSFFQSDGTSSACTSTGHVTGTLVR